MRFPSREVWLFCALAACGGNKDAAAPSPSAEPAKAPAELNAPAPTPDPAAAAPAAPVAIAPDESGVVHISSSDQMRYSAGRINVKAGQNITIELKNAGNLPKEAMGHNLVLLKPGVDPMAFAMKGIAAKATDYVPADSADQVLAHTKLLGPGESDSIKLTAPAPGTYPFVCTFPGHAALMNGQLVVE